MKAIRLLLVIVLCARLPQIALGAEPSPTVSLESLSPGLANKIVVSAVAECTKQGYKVSAAVVGRDGNLLAFLRNPLSGPHTILVSQKKAYSASTLQARTSQMQSRTDLSFAPGILLIVGGVPISVAGKFYGGVAVAGAEPAIDEKCAEAGIAAVQEILEFAQ
jgi:uncharacterized protein GlcG (DUF336 family)